MKTFYRFAFLIIAVIFSMHVNAQSRLTEEQKKELSAKFEEYKAKLNLSDTQQEKVKAINTTYFEGLASLKESGGSKLSRLKTLRKITDEKDKQMKTVLDEGQYETYKKMQKEMREEFKKKRKQ
ncbi:hypothetical protein [Pseudoflavitalea rhizosphaerae]|uniref:hypothetical protein n=1 Tax=Pseudoflavitalea rhizosphaerae TaxID=1884793 RepID=UPI000F8F36BC|nr:hypothetical protein [Pseudoflavitalea rhizosphaerae]